MNPSINNAMESPSSQIATVSGTPNGTRDIITIGEKKGIILLQVARELVGSFIELTIIMMAMMIGIVIGNVRLCASCASSFTALPTAANKAA